MKTKISLFAMLFLMPLFTLVFFSCAKEELVPTATLDKMNIESAKSETPESASRVTLSQAVKVAIRGFDCPDQGEWLLVYNPNEPDLNFYNVREYSVRWMKDGNPAGGTNRLGCTCRGRYTATVRNNVTMQIIGSAFYQIENDCSVTNTGTGSDDL